MISWLRDKDIKGVRKLSVLLPKWLLPAPEKIGKHVLRTLDGLKLIIDPSVDQGVELSLYQTGTYEKGILNFIEKNFDEKGVFLDIGANIGLMSIFTAVKFPKASIVAYEAHPETFKILNANLELNELKNVRVAQKAVGQENGRVKIFDNWSVNRGGASIKYGDSISDGIEVELIVLDDVLDVSPTMIKIDIEGAELDALIGLKKTIKNSKPTLIVEISQERVDEDEVRKIYDLIKSFDAYTIYKLEGGKERISNLIQIKKFDELPEHDNVICVAEA